VSVAAAGERRARVRRRGGRSPGVTRSWSRLAHHDTPSHIRIRRILSHRSRLHRHRHLRDASIAAPPPPARRRGQQRTQDSAPLGECRRSTALTCSPVKSLKLSTRGRSLKPSARCWRLIASAGSHSHRTTRRLPLTAPDPAPAVPTMLPRMRWPQR
jgi:hypothetical protein